MSYNAVTLPLVEACIADRGRRLAFPQAIEAVYDEQMQSYRLKVMAKGLLPLVLIYNVFLLADALLVPQTLLLATFLHLGVITPVILLIAYVYPRLKRQYLRECAASAIPFMMVAQIMAIYLLNSGDAADHYQYLAIMIVIYMNVNQRFGFRVAVGSTVLLAVTYVAMLLPGQPPLPVVFTGISMMGSAAYLSLMANQRMERDVRHAFLRRLRDQLKREAAESVAKLDALTGLANRRYLEETVAQLGEVSGDRIGSTAVVMIDIDRFKPFNDRYGHVYGDTCLKRVAGAIAAECRNQDDLAVRLGGEEFLMLLPQTEMSEAVRVAERVRRQVEALGIPNEGLGTSGIVTVSLGVVAGPASARDFAELITGADTALYAAKRNGRNQVWPPFVRKDNPVTSLHASDTDRPRKWADNRAS